MEKGSIPLLGKPKRFAHRNCKKKGKLSKLDKKRTLDIKRVLHADAVSKKRHEAPKGVSLDRLNMAPELILNEDLMTVDGFKGYRTVLASHAVIEGTYYVECKFDVSPVAPQFPDVKGHMRLGIAPVDFDKEYPLGYDQKSYSFRDTDGATFYNGESTEYGTGFNPGDVIGLMLHMEPPKPAFIQKQIAPGKSEVNEGSFLIFYVNGKAQGKAFTDLRQHFYRVGVSLYMNSRAKMNFGPNFEYTPDTSALTAQGMIIPEVKPYCNISSESTKYPDLDRH